MPRRSFLETIQSKKILWFFITSYDFIFVVVLMWLYSMTLFHNKILIINNCFVVAVISLPIGVQLFVTPWTVTHQVSLSMGFPRQEHWSGLPFPSPGDLPNLGIKPISPALQADSSTSKLPGFETQNELLMPQFSQCDWARLMKMKAILTGPATFLCDPLYPLPSPLSNCLKGFHAQEPHRVLLNFIMAAEERLSYPSDGLCFLEVSTVCIA